MIYDIFTYNGERDILDIRFNVLKNFVDQFVICEAPITFSGKDKPLYFLDLQEKYKDLPIKYFVINEPVYSQYAKMAKASPNTEYGKGAKHWLTEFAIKESLKDALLGLNDEDTVFISDCDEIWNPDNLDILSEGVYKLSQKMYVYYLNMRSSEEWYGTLVTKYKNIKNSCLNHLRTSGYTKIENDGWHFSSVGGIDELRRKLNDSYTAESNNTLDVQAKLAERYGKEDFLGRPFNWAYFIDESRLPKYLKLNREKYEKLYSNSSI